MKQLYCMLIIPQGVIFYGTIILYVNNTNGLNN